MANWKDVVRAVAPTVATALGSPLAGTAVKILSEVLLGKPNGTEQELQEAVRNATPEQLLQLRNADYDYAIQIKKLDIDLETSYVQDTHNARLSHAGDKRVFWLGVAILVTFATAVTGVLYSAHQILLTGMQVADPGTAAVVFTLIGTMIGYVTANAQQVISYFFGSSAGSKEKTSAMSKAVEELGKR